MSRIAIAVWRGCVATTLDFARTFLLVDVDGGAILARKEIGIESAPAPTFAIKLRELGVTNLICGAISRCLLRYMETDGIHVSHFVSGNAEEVLKAFLGGNLHNDRFLMAGCHADARREWRCRKRS
jgi:predicted Fe-Mo cluster-binding NifX family protein